MAYCRSGWMCSVLLLHASALLLLPSPVLSSDLDQEEQNLLNGLNNYRKTNNLPDLSEVRGASCLANKIATQFQDSQSCFALPSEGSYSISAGSGNSIPGYYRLLGDCGLDIENTKNGVILPACVGDINNDLTYAISNFTETSYAQYLRNSHYTGAGIGSEGVWAVVVLTTDDQGGDFSGGRSLGLGVGDLLVAFWLIVMNYWVVCFMTM